MLRGGRRLQRQASRHFEVWQQLPLIDVPTLVMGGQQDRVVPPANNDVLLSQLGFGKRPYHSGSGPLADG